MTLMGPGGIDIEVWNTIRDTIHETNLLAEDDEEIMVNALVTKLRGYNPASGKKTAP